MKICQYLRVNDTEKRKNWPAWLVSKYRSRDSRLGLGCQGMAVSLVVSVPSGQTASNIAVRFLKQIEILTPDDHEMRTAKI